MRAARTPTARCPAVTLAAAAVAGVDEVYRIGGAQAIARHGLRHRDRSAPVDVIVGPGQRLRGAGQAGGRRRWSASRRRSPARPRSWSSPTTTAPPSCAAIDVIVQAEHGPDGLAWLVTWDEAVADAVVRRGRGAGRRRRRGGPRSRRRSPSGGYARAGRRARAGDRRSPTPSPPSTSSCMTADPEALLPLVRHAGAVFCGPWAPAVGRRLRRRAEPRAAHRTARPASPARCASTTSSSTSTSSRSTSAALAAVAPHVAALAEAEGLAAHAESVRAPTAGDRGRSARIAPRDDVALMEGYHSPQVDVDVRLNTNESPVPPPAGVRATRWPTSWPRVDWHRYPDRAAAELRAAHRRAARRRPDQVFAANGSNEVLQTLCLAYGGAGPDGRGVRADLRAAHPHRPDHRHRRWPPASGPTTSPSTSTRCAGCSPRPTPAITFLCSPNNPTGMVEPPEAVRGGGSTWRPALVVVDEAYGQFAAVVGARAGRRRPRRSSSPARTRRRGRWPRPGSATSSGPRWLVAELEKVVLPYHLDAVKQVAGRLALRLRRRDGGAGGRAGRGAGAAGRRRSADLPVDVWPSGANFVLFRPDDRRRRTRCGRRLLDRSVLVRDCASWPRLDGCLRVTVGTPDEDDALPRRPRGGPRHERRAAATRAHDQGDDDRGRARPRRAPARSTASHRAAVLRPHARPARPARRLRPRRSQATGDLAGRRPPHRRGRRHPARRGVRARRWATRPACAASPVGPLPARRGARRGRPRPVGPAVRRLRGAVRRGAARSATRRSTRRWPSTSGSRSPPPPASRCTCGRRPGATPTTSSRPSFKGVARCLRDAVRVEGGGVPSTKGTL